MYFLLDIQGINTVVKHFTCDKNEQISLNFSSVRGQSGVQKNDTLPFIVFEDSDEMGIVAT